jgi:predicted TIM-barrel fold metal-dependent hydrolase
MTVAGLIDASVHHDWDDDRTILEYVSPGWRDYLSQSMDLPGGAPMAFVPGVLQLAPGDLRERARTLEPETALAAERVVLSHGRGALTTVITNPSLAEEIARAINDWTIELWLDDAPEGRHALALVPNQLPERAAAEVRRVAGHPRIAGLLLGASALGRPFGHQIYHPIYEAAAEMGLPVVVRADCDQPAETLSNPTGGGLPAAFVESYVLGAQSLAAAVASFIGQGVFERFPDLKLFVEGAGAAWLPSLMWRFDCEWAPSRREVPWLEMRPTEYLLRNVRVSTNPLERGDVEAWRRLVAGSIDGLEQVLVYASGYPDWDADDPETVEAHLPPEWHERVMRDNAADLFRWDAVKTERSADDL